jgi:hypothetical protein
MRFTVMDFMLGSSIMRDMGPHAIRICIEGRQGEQGRPTQLPLPREASSAPLLRPSAAFNIAAAASMGSLPMAQPLPVAHLVAEETPLGACLG